MKPHAIFVRCDETMYRILEKEAKEKGVCVSVLVRNLAAEHIGIPGEEDFGELGDEWTTVKSVAKETGFTYSQITYLMQKHGVSIVKASKRNKVNLSELKCAMKYDLFESKDSSNLKMNKPGQVEKVRRFLEEGKANADE